MNVDEKITYEFYKGWITASAYKLYLKQLFESKVATPHLDEPVSSHRDKANELHTAITNGTFIGVDDWEKKFVSDQRFVEGPSEAQKNRLDMTWNRYRGE